MLKVLGVRQDCSTLPLDTGLLELSGRDTSLLSSTTGENYIQHKPLNPRANWPKSKEFIQNGALEASRNVHPGCCRGGVLPVR